MCAEGCVYDVLELSIFTIDGSSFEFKGEMLHLKFKVGNDRQILPILLVREHTYALQKLGSCWQATLASHLTEGCTGSNEKSPLKR
jgi:hypothetical protein